MATDPHTYEIQHRARKHLSRLMTDTCGVRDWRKKTYGEDAISAVERIALAYAVLDFFLDEARWDRFETAMVALRRRNEARRRADAA